VSITPAAALRRLEALRLEFGGRGEKLRLLRVLEHARLHSAHMVLRLHEQLCFMRAYPEDAQLLTLVEAMLERFAHRTDLRRFRSALADSGIAGTAIHYRFFWPTARWLRRRWPEQLAIDWSALEDSGRLSSALPLLATPLEATWLRARLPEARSALEHLSGGAKYPARFLIDRISSLPGNDVTREYFCDALDIPYVLHPGCDTPSRTSNHVHAPVAFVRSPLSRSRPDLRTELRRPPRSVRPASRREAMVLIECAHEALVTRSRDLDAFSYADVRDVWIVDDGEGLQWALIGMVPERRLLLRAAYGFLTMRNGVPIGYGQLDALCRTIDISFNSFETFRGSEVARVFARLLAAGRAFFGAAAFTLEPYQLGHHNREAVASGAWWFYYKLGFRPRNPAIRALAQSELLRMQAEPGHRSSSDVLKRLASDYLYFETEGVRAPYWPRLAELGVRAAEHLTAVGGSDRERAVRECVERALRRLGLKSLPAGRSLRLAWERWAPIVALLGMTDWSRSEKRSLGRVISARAAASDRDFLDRFDAHPRLARALRELVRG